MSKIVSLDPTQPDPFIITEAATILKNGGIIAFPTDTSYGLAVNPYDDKAVKRLFKIKGRHPSKPIILLIDNISKLETLVEKTESPLINLLMSKFWPGPLTLVFKEKSHLNKRIMGGTRTIAIRLPNAVIPILIMQETGFPITATSANHSGEKPAKTSEEIEEKLGKSLDLILDVGFSEAISSTILDISSLTPKILRMGGISSETLNEFIAMNKPI